MSVTLTGGQGYSSKAIRAELRRRNISHTIPERKDQKNNRARRGSVGGRRPKFDKERYKNRNVVERFFNRLKQWRAGDPLHQTRPLLLQRDHHCVDLHLASRRSTGSCLGLSAPPG